MEPREDGDEVCSELGTDLWPLNDCSKLVDIDIDIKPDDNDDACSELDTDLWPLNDRSKLVDIDMEPNDNGEDCSELDTDLWPLNDCSKLIDNDCFMVLDTGFVMERVMTLFIVDACDDTAAGCCS